MTSLKYLAQLKSLLPSGRFLRFDGTLGAALGVVSDELQTIEDRSWEAVLERRPTTAFEMLEEYEDQYGLPSTGTLAQRWARVISKRYVRHRTRPIDYQERFAAVLAAHYSAIIVIERGRTFAIAAGDDREIYRFFLWRDPFYPPEYSIDDAQALLESYVQSHTKGQVIQSVDFLCDDEFSLCDRDLLEASALIGLSVWIRGDDELNVIESSAYVSARNRGSLGTPATLDDNDPGPQVITHSNGLQSMYTTTNGGMVIYEDIDLHSPDAIATVECHLTIESFGSAQRPFATKNVSVGSGRGVMLQITSAGLWRLTVANSATDVIDETSAAATSLGAHAVQMRKNGQLYQLFVDGVEVISASSAALEAGAASTELQIGSFRADPFSQVLGSVDEFKVWTRPLSNEELAMSRGYLSRWSAP